MMEKRKPLSVMIAMQADKLRGGKADDKEPDGDEGDGDEEMGGKYDDEGMITASEDMIDAFKNRDAKALNRALVHWYEMCQSHGMGDEEDKGKRY